MKRTLPSACLWLVLCTASCGGERETGSWTATAWKQKQTKERHPSDVALSLAATAQLRTDARVWSQYRLDTLIYIY